MERSITTARWHTRAPLRRLSKPKMNHARLSLILLGTLSALCPRPVSAYEVSGDLKLFHMMSGAPRGLETLGGTSAGATTSRLVLKERYRGWRFESHGLLSALQQGRSGSVFSLSPNLNQAGEALPLSDQVIDDGEASAILRADRLLISYEGSQTRVTLGRQAISFGQGRVFTPLDRVSPFSPASVDREYKPGVDALRIDGYWGVAGEWTLIGAQRDGFALEQSVFGAKLRDDFGGWDLALLGLWLGGDRVAGLSVAGTLSELSIYSDFSYTWRAQRGALAEADAARGETDPFIRAVIGGDWSWSAAGGGQVNVEFAWLGDGAATAEAYLNSALDPRALRGERWLLAQRYLSLSARQSLTPLVSGALSVIANLQDPSALIGPALSWSISDESSANLGGYLGFGEGVEGFAPRSEFGALSWLTFVMVSAYY